MKIVVIGGSGLIGSKLVNKLREQGHEAVGASPNSGVNTITGEGLVARAGSSRGSRVPMRWIVQCRDAGHLILSGD
jgi:nucleoside-diphosphate-sugar epimerase